MPITDRLPGGEWTRENPNQLVIALPVSDKGSFRNSYPVTSRSDRQCDTMMTQDYIAPELSVKNFPRRGLRVSGVLSLRGRGPIRETPINLPIVLLGNMFEAALRQLCMRISTPQIDTFFISVRLNRVSLAGDYCLAQARRVLAAEVAEYDVLSESAAIPREIDERRMFAVSTRETGPGCDAESAGSRLAPRRHFAKHLADPAPA